MYRYCERCERETFDGNLWCQDPDCPAEQGYGLLSYGDFLGDLKVTKLIRVWRTASLYEALREEEQVLLKVAHPGDDNAERLRQEALALESLSPKQAGFGAFIRSFLPKSRPLYPLLFSPYPTSSKQPYGEITFRGEPRVYSVFQHARGKILSDLLLETPQIWHTQAAWIVMTIAKALKPLAASNLCHLSLTPDMIMVDTDAQGNFRPLILDLGFILPVGENNNTYNLLKLCEPAYTAYEMLVDSQNNAHTLAADVYSLGMIFFEMLAGRPGFENKLRRDSQLRDDVLHIRNPLSVGRPELQQSGVIGILEHAVAITGRYNNVMEFSNALREVYSSPPPERLQIPRRLWVLILIAVVVLLIAGVIAVITLLQVLAL
jgi:serine/threonine protein kinase